MKPTTIRQFFQQFPDDDACLKHLFDVRFGQGHTCPKCKRDARWYPIKAERAFSCQWCGHHIHPTVGTLFEKSRTPLQLWFYVIFKFTKTRHDVSAKEIERELGVTYKTAWRMCRMIREHMAEIDGEDPLGGNGAPVEVDETYVGGVAKGVRGRGAKNKTVVFGMAERGGKVMVKVVPNATRKTLHPIIEQNVTKGAEVHADTCGAYDGLDGKGDTLKRINKHATGKYVGPNGETVNAIENFWRQLKNGIEGTHIWVSPKYLERYAKEFEYRFNRRNCPETMLSELLTSFSKADA